jgi:hypothetical protein
LISVSGVGLAELAALSEIADVLVETMTLGEKIVG